MRMVVSFSWIVFFPFSLGAVWRLRELWDDDLKLIVMRDMENSSNIF